jgi:MFS family permease
MFDQGVPLLVTSIAAALNLGTLQTASLFAIRQAGSSVTSLGGGPVVDMLKPYWGIILIGCMLGHAVSFSAIGASPTFGLLVLAFLLVSMPGSLWHLPSAAAISQRFPDRRGFAISMHGFGSNVGNILGPIAAGALLGLGALIWRHVFFIYAGMALVMTIFVWWSLRALGTEDKNEEQIDLVTRFKSALGMLKTPVVLALIGAALLRGIGLNALFNWAPFYLRESLGMGNLQAGTYFALLTGMGIVSAPVLGLLSDRFGRKAVLVPGLITASVLSFLVVSVGDSLALIPIMAGMGLFSFALHQIIQASVLDVVGPGTEATAIGLLFGINGVIGIGSPFLASAIIGFLGGYGGIFYYAGILTAISAVITIAIPLRPQNITPTAG